ncbi:EthD family reductase [Streptomyces coffeae]|uniref:EthD family reductase n=1 Tax=Streptomyces coffeae TaxID=621382 RepID=A0ABS1NPS0_9ACTN|nr:EthD family reductase [Streptomyces coffeae]MBL1102013.1 EthD family reductase [Streptomyces coffeae]
MHRLTVLYPHPVDPDHFRDYYTSVHLQLAAKLPGMRAMRHSFDVSAVDGESPYFAIWEAEFDSVEAMGKAMESPQGHAVVADVPNYATGGAHVLHFRLGD